MKKLLLALLILVSGIASAQVLASENRIVVMGQATVEAPADQVSFNINLLSTDTLSLDKMYAKHKAMESKIYRILKDLNIPSDKISYSLLSVGKRPSYAEKDEDIVWYFEGTQEISFTLDSLKTYPAIRDRLIREGVIRFGSAFTSSKEEEMKKEVLTKAVKVATEKAEVLAKAGDRKIKRIVKIADTDDTDPMFENYTSDTIYAVAGADATGGSAEGTLIEIPQNISVSATVKVTFQLK
ncbi:SIMPL domain-containing protein [Rufibacter sediminis]|uniref:SIMPL domain-containing protein n=1 Tax=Rufibacter sediminis TaxID=2762756 RepID=A0ABR6VZV8_9BACT|nr:SIMPL domain-containing protein [Rufibacter sediminis]MBC3542415.1 SIMPL domain-containing protein [Rufibacter sediminis]